MRRALERALEQDRVSVMPRFAVGGVRIRFRAVLPTDSQRTVNTESTTRKKI